MLMIKLLVVGRDCCCDDCCDGCNGPCIAGELVMMRARSSRSRERISGVRPSTGGGGGGGGDRGMFNCLVSSC